ncbi:MAG TPA: sulfatase-like hydrolase/transferase, partial [Gammaproteobacteria bacterium]|nr:sulfatase-like hydrolase/transferase [Gammaproteobacteria bacterium]
MRRVTRSFALVVALALAASGCARQPPAAPTRFAGAPVVLISIDTLRADHLAAYGYRAGSTPAIDRLAQAGVVFDDAYSQSP